MNKEIKILLIDDDEEDFLLTKEVVNEIPNKRYHLDWISSYEEGKKVMMLHQHDVYLVDYRLGSMIGLELIKEVLDHGFDAPLILLTGLKDTQIDEDAVKAGAADYLTKSGLSSEMLDRSIRYSIAQSTILKEIKQLNADLEKRVEQRTEALTSALFNLAKSEKELQNSLSKEKALNELKSRFVTTASHEFRTPLTVILSSSRLIEGYDKTEDAGKRMKHIDRIKSCVSNLTRILDDFLSLGKIEEGLLKNNPEEFEFVPFVKSVIEELKNSTKDNQQIIYSHSGENCFVELDKQLFKNILMNLLSNAIKYSPPEKSIEFKTECLKTNILINITDKGIGIPDEDKIHLFEKFFRAKNAMDIEGTGLGLNIIKKYIELMNGEISFLSSLNTGTTFTVKLPIKSIIV